MTSQSLYRKWRSQTFDEMVGQEEIVTTLKNAIKSGNIRHAYLFTGPRGTGKTTTARLLAKTVNCTNPQDGTPCNECQQCREITAGNSFNVIEIDAASNRGIDSIRDLREKVMMPPATGKYKVYVLDEAHMLTTEAFNALLKTLEEPPPYVIFVLATTDVHKMLPTVISRCQRFDFKRFTTRQIVKHLEFVAGQEQVKLERSASELIARAAAGGMRDALSLLDQAIAYAGEEISLAQVQAMLGVADPRAISKLITGIAELDSPTVLHLIHELAEAGADLRQVNTQVVEYWRALMLTRAGADTASILDLTEDEMRDIKQLSQLFDLEELTECARIFAQNELTQKNQGTPQLGLELASLECIEAHRRAQSGQPRAAVAAAATPVGQHRLPVSHVPAQPENLARLSQPSHAQKSSASRSREESFVSSSESTFSAPVEEKEEVQPLSSSANGGNPSLTVQRVSEAWENVRKRTKQKSKSGLMAAYLDHFEVVSIEGTTEQTIVIIQAAKQVHYTFVKENNRLKDLEWALTMEFGQPCQVRLLAPGQSLSPASAYGSVPSSENTMQGVAAKQSAYLEPPVSAPPAGVEQKSADSQMPTSTSYPVDAVSTNEVRVPPVAKNGFVRENISVLSSREIIQQQAERDPVVQEIIKTFAARIVDVYPK
ncbi:MAG TPA: DNA polymerase III subunit gamma/tau [Ktedonobacteraceae bacterium]